MNNKEAAEIIRNITSQPQYEDALFYGLIGVRFDSIPYQVGDIMPDSKAFFPTEESDVRDFPTYDSKDYDDLPTMGGTSAWSIREILWRLDRKPDGNELKDTHCHIIISDRFTNPDVVDDGEIVLIDPTVIAVLS